MRGQKGHTQLLRFDEAVRPSTHIPVYPVKSNRLGVGLFRGNCSRSRLPTSATYVEPSLMTTVSRGSFRGLVWERGGATKYWGEARGGKLHGMYRDGWLAQRLKGELGSERTLERGS